MALTNHEIAGMNASDLRTEVRGLQADDTHLRAENERLKKELRKAMLAWAKTLKQLKAIHADTEWTTTIDVYGE